MNHLTFLLYILAKSVSSIRPQLVEALRQWPQLHHDLNLNDPDLKSFCQHLLLTPAQTEKFLENYNAGSATEFIKLLKKKGIHAINIFENEYPELLNSIPDPPLVLYCRGNSSLLNSKSVAIVGSRKASSYGKSVVEKIISGLSEHGVVTISGLAFGIDASVHDESLKHNLPTIAVLGGGIDNDSIYPREHYLLAQRILKSSGLIISEYPPLAEAMKHQFIARNRVIAALSQATVIIEAAEKSGALFTADFAADYNRSVLAVPGSITSQLSFGPHELIKKGAALLSSADDLLFELGIDPISGAVPKLKPDEQSVWECINCNKGEFEYLAKSLSFSPAQLSIIITSLELKNLIYQSAPQVYSPK
ncbi:DNA-protecting protein DprA [bacterium]|nr:MAG: DNA-protecting protein DprA [bacterium]